MEKTVIIYLLSSEFSKDENNIFTQKEVKTKVFAEKSSVSQTEFYKAGAAGLKLSYKFIILESEYSGEEFVIFNDKKYKVERTYNRNDERIELTVREINANESRS